MVDAHTLRLDEHVLVAMHEPVAMTLPAVHMFMSGHIPVERCVHILGTYRGRCRIGYVGSLLVLVLLVEFEPEVLVGGRLKHAVPVLGLC